MEARRPDVSRRAFLAGLPAALAWLPGLAGQQRDLVVFAAASLSDALAEIARAFEAGGGRHVQLSFGGSNDLARQIRAGAPAEIFVSADARRMNELEQAGLVRRQERFDLVSNRLVVIVPAVSSHPFGKAEDLLLAQRIALADPDAVPAGIYAREWLQRRGLWDRLRARVVPALDVRAALAAVASQAVDAGIVYRTDAAVSDRVRVALEVPAEESPRIVYPAALVGTPSAAARAFFAYLRSPEARAVLSRFGFEPLGR